MISKNLRVLCFLFFLPVFSRAENTATETTPKEEASTEASEKNPYVAGLLGETFPGAGYFYLGDYKKAAYASTLIIPLAAPYYITTPRWTTKSIKANIHTLARNTFGYTVYDSFQQGMTESHREKAVVKMPHHSFKDMALFPTKLENYRHWQLLVPVGLVSLGSVSRLAQHGISRDLKWHRAALSLPAIFALSFFIGMGEEAEFRGYQYPAFSQLTGHEWMGNILQAASFGTCHTSWGICSSPYLTGQIFRHTRTLGSNEYKAPSSPSDGGDISDFQYFLSTFISGLWFGYTARTGDQGLLRAMTTHALWDAILITTDLLTTANTGRIYLNFSLPLP